MRRCCAISALVCLIAASIATFGQPHDSPRFSVTDLGSSEAVAITEDGQVLGSDHGNLPWVWHEGVRTSLGLNGSGSAINRKGHVVGLYDTGEFYPVAFSFFSVSHAFIWQDGKVIDLGTFGGRNSYATSINDSDQVVGMAEDSSQTPQPFLWQNGVKAPLQSLIPAATDWQLESVLRITDDARVFGIGLLQGSRRVFQLTPLPDGFYALTELGPLTGYMASLAAFNELGWASGHADLLEAHGLQAVLWRGGVLTPLGNLGSPASYGRGINNRGQVVGLSNSSSYRAFLWSEGMIYDLNSLIPRDSGWVFLNAQAINDAGQIIGDGMIGPNHRAFLLNPAPNPSKRFRLMLRLPTVTTDEALDLAAENVPTGKILIEISTNLLNWTPLATPGSGTNGAWSWTITKQGTDGSARFFRAVAK